MPASTCDQNALGFAYHEVAEAKEGVSYSYHWKWDGTSVWPNCNGTIIYMWVKNSNNAPRWVLLPAKRSGTKWQQIPANYEHRWDTELPNNAGTPVLTTGQQAVNDLRGLGIDEYLDVKNTQITAIDPAL